MTMPRNDDEDIQKQQLYNIIYSQLGYLYIILPNAPCSQSGDKEHRFAQEEGTRFCTRGGHTTGGNGLTSFSYLLTSLHYSYRGRKS